MEKLQLNQNSQPTTAQQQSGGLSINSVTPAQRELCKQVVHVNQLTAFPLTAGQIADWAKSIEELKPEITPEILKRIIDLMKLGEIEYDTKRGIQNIFEAYEELYAAPKLVR